MLAMLRRAATAICLACLLVACNGSDSGNHGTNLGDSFYEPLIGVAPAGGSFAGLWLVSSAHPGAVPIQVTYDGVDVNRNDSGATFYDWTYSTDTRRRDGLIPRFFVYGSRGHLFGISLSQPESPQQLSDGIYSRLCRLDAAQTGPFSNKPSFVIAQVALTSGSADCDTTWIISTGADGSAAPATTAGLLTFLGSLKDTSTGFVTAFLVAAGSEVDFYSPTVMRKTSTLVPGLLAGGSAAMVGITMDSTQAVVVESAADGSIPVQDQLYLVNTDGATLVDEYTSPGMPGCVSLFGQPRVAGAVIGSSVVYAVRDPLGGAGYTVFSEPLSGGRPNLVYTSTACEEGLFRAVAGRLVVQQFDESKSSEEIISLDPAGPSTQIPVLLASFSNTDEGEVEFLTTSDVWIDTFSVDTSGDVLSFGTSVVDARDGRILKTFPGSQAFGDIWEGFGSDNSLIKKSILVYGVTLTGPCDAQLNVIQVVDTESLSSSALPISAQCADSMVGPAPLALGGLDGSGYALSVPSTGKPRLLNLKVKGQIPAISQSIY